MKSKHQYILVLIICLFSFSYGYFVSRDRIFPYKILKNFFGEKSKGYIIHENAKKKTWYKKMMRESDNKVIIIKNYNEGYYIFNDKPYTNSFNDEVLIGKTLIQISRHRKDSLKITLKENAFIYRILCEVNDNSHYSDWLNTDYNVKINGLSCVHKKMIKKFFLKGTAVVEAGGPVAADPIFLEASNLDK